MKIDKVKALLKGVEDWIKEEILLHCRSMDGLEVLWLFKEENLQSVLNAYKIGANSGYNSMLWYEWFIIYGNDGTMFPERVAYLSKKMEKLETEVRNEERKKMLMDNGYSSTATKVWLQPVYHHCYGSVAN